LKNKHKLISPTELVDCDTLDSGCGGGLPENAYKALEKLGGIETESAYPYDGHNDKCSFDASKAAARVTGFVELPKNETEMAMWLLKNGPISIGINANAMQVRTKKKKTLIWLG
jgi:cathepsin F